MITTENTQHVITAEPLVNIKPSADIDDTQPIISIINNNTRRPVDFAFAEMHGCIISGNAGAGKSSILASLAHTRDNDADTTLYVYEEKSYIAELCTNATVIHTPSDAERVIFSLETSYNDRDEDSAGKIVLCIDDFFRLYQALSQTAADILEAIVRGGDDRGMFVYVTCTPDELVKFSQANVSLFYELQGRGNAILVGGSLKSHKVFNDLHKEDDISFGKNEGALLHDGRVTPVIFSGLQEVQPQ